jgi:aminoglycoside 6-adenylyltransferase
MRNEQEMYHLILQTAKEDDRIRAVYLNGSRTNKDAPKDLFQDYDVVYVVNDTIPFVEDRHWIDRFGKRLYWQEPDFMDKLLGKSFDASSCYGWLMQFADGNRMDLHVVSIPYAKQTILKDSLCVVLLDKDGLLPKIPASTDQDYWLKPPTKELFFCTCNECWWCLNNVAKGLWRDELPYVMEALGWVRPMLLRMLCWKAGIATNFQKSAGKAGKYLYRYLPHDVYQAYLDTFPRAEVSDVWRAVWVLCRLFDETAKEIADYFHFTYNETEAINSQLFLKMAEQLPKDAIKIPEIPCHEPPFSI